MWLTSGWGRRMFEKVLMNIHRRLLRGFGLVVMASLGALILVEFWLASFSHSYSWSPISKITCSLFHPGKEYRRMGDDGRSTDQINDGWWCVDEDDLREWRARAG